MKVLLATSLENALEIAWRGRKVIYRPRPFARAADTVSIYVPGRGVVLEVPIASAVSGSPRAVRKKTAALDAPGTDGDYERAYGDCPEMTAHVLGEPRAVDPPVALSEYAPQIEREPEEGGYFYIP